MEKQSKKEKKRETLKYDPAIKPRYLPGEVDEIIATRDFITYREHREKLRNAKAKVDNFPPRFATDTYYNKTKLIDNAQIVKNCYNANLDLAQRINKVFRMGGRTDCWNFRSRKHDTTQYSEKLNSKNIEKANRVTYCKVTNKPPGEYSPQVMAKKWKIAKAEIILKQKYPWFKEESEFPSITDIAIPPPDKAAEANRSICFFDLEINESRLPLGRIVFQLYNDYVPLVCDNFLAFCKGHNGLSYKGTPLHRIVSGYWCQGGDVTKFNGVGGASIYKDVPVKDINRTLTHNRSGVLSTYGDGKQVCDSKFNLTFRPLQTMDGRKVVFGKVVKGMQVLYKLDAYGTKYGSPLQRITISNCGILRFKTIKSNV